MNIPAKYRNARVLTGAVCLGVAGAVLLSLILTVLGSPTDTRSRKPVAREATGATSSGFFSAATAAVPSAAGLDAGVSFPSSAAYDPHTNALLVGSYATGSITRLTAAGDIPLSEAP